MNNCCSNSESSAHYPKSHTCPANGVSYASVKPKTLLHHIRKPWQHSITPQGYYFCTDPECDVVYFAQDNTTIQTHDVRTTVWQKSNSEKAKLCYCFGVTKKQAISDKEIKTFCYQTNQKFTLFMWDQQPLGALLFKRFPLAMNKHLPAQITLANTWF